MNLSKFSNNLLDRFVIWLEKKENDFWDRELKKYEPCHQLEAEFLAKWKDKEFIDFEQSTDLVHWLCERSHVKHPKGVVVHSYFRDPCYNIWKQKIYLHSLSDITVVVHETAHHIHCQQFLGKFDKPHGKKFLKIEAELFDHLLKAEKLMHRIYML